MLKQSHAQAPLLVILLLLATLVPEGAEAQRSTSRRVTLTPLWVFLGFAGFFLLILFLMKGFCCSQRQPNGQVIGLGVFAAAPVPAQGVTLQGTSSPPDEEAFLNANLPTSAQGDALLYPAGSWRGYSSMPLSEYELYEQDISFYASGNHDVVIVDGAGVDDIGQYTLKGLCNPFRRRLSLHQTYIPGTGDFTRNHGQTVEYRAFGGLLPAHGFQGKWYTQSPPASGNFHWWPATALEDGVRPDQRSSFCVMSTSATVASEHASLSAALATLPPASYESSQGFIIVYCPPTKDSPPAYAQE